MNDARINTERLILQHKDAVYRQMVRVCGNREDAEDALANAIFAAIRASDQLRDPSAFRSWLATIGARACVRMRIREQLMQMTSLSELADRGWEIPDPNPDAAAEAEVASLKRCILGAIELLSERLRCVYLRCEIYGECVNHVAQSLGLSAPVVKTRLHRARKFVREALDSGIGCAPA